MTFRLPFVWLGKPFRTLCEQRKASWGGEPVRYRYVFPVANKWKVRIPRTAVRRRAS